MTVVLLGMLEGLRDALDKPDRRQIDHIERADDVLDSLNAAIGRVELAVDPDRQAFPGELVDDVEQPER